jgi:hypothetical protein
MQTFVDENGVERIVAELCGRCIEQNGKLVGDPKSVEFIEASWVENPAFKGAVINHYISDISDEQKAILASDNKIINFNEMYSSLSKLRVADTAGMLALRVAQSELKRLEKNNLVNRVVIWSRNNLVF